MSGHSLSRFKTKLVNTPHLIEQTSFSQIMEYVNRRIEGNADIIPKMSDDEDDYEDFDPEERYRENYNPDTKTGILYIDGSLTYKPTGWEAFCGGTSYVSLKEQMEYFVRYGAKTVAMICDSGGGEAHSMFDTANYLRKLADDNGIKILCFVDGTSASASYGLSAIADEIIMSVDSQVGSIGVLIQLINNSKNLEMNGYERTFITAGSGKVPWDDNGEFREDFLKRLQDQVDTLYEGFTSHVAGYRGISQEAVKATEANMFLSKEAIQLGLADKVMTVEEFYEYLAEVAQSNLEGNKMGTTSKNRIFSFMNKTQEDITEMAQLEEMQAQLKAANEQLAGMATLSAQVAEIQAAFGAQTEELKAAKQALAAMEEAKAQAAAEARKASLAEFLPADQVEANLSALSGLDEASFSVVVNTMKAAKEAQAASGMMAEIGSEGAELEQEDSTGEDPITKAALARLRGQRR